VFRQTGSETNWPLKWVKLAALPGESRKARGWKEQSDGQGRQPRTTSHVLSRIEVAGDSGRSAGRSSDQPDVREAWLIAVKCSFLLATIRIPVSQRTVLQL